MKMSSSPGEAFIVGGDGTWHCFFVFVKDRPIVFWILVEDMNNLKLMFRRCSCGLLSNDIDNCIHTISRYALGIVCDEEFVLM